MAFAKRALEHTAGEVREAAVHLIIELYRRKAAAVRSHLPSEDDPKTMKNPLYCKIFDGMDRADGKPTKAERKVLFFLLFTKKCVNENVVRKQQPLCKGFLV